jgi:hypothetical protein
MADAPDSKSGGVNPREGSSPSSGTSKINNLVHYPQYYTSLDTLTLTNLCLSGADRYNVSVFSLHLNPLDCLSCRVF